MRRFIYQLITVSYYMVLFKQRLPLFILFLLFLLHFTGTHPYSLTLSLNHSFTYPHSSLSLSLFYHSLTFSSSTKMNEKHWESECVRAQSEAARHLSNLEMARSDIMYVRTVQMNSVRAFEHVHAHVQLPLSPQITSSFLSLHPFWILKTTVIFWWMVSHWVFLLVSSFCTSSRIIHIDLFTVNNRTLYTTSLYVIICFYSILQFAQCFEEVRSWAIRESRSLCSPIWRSAERAPITQTIRRPMCHRSSRVERRACRYKTALPSLVTMTSCYIVYPLLLEWAVMCVNGLQCKNSRTLHYNILPCNALQFSAKYCTTTHAWCILRSSLSPPSIPSFSSKPSF